MLLYGLPNCDSTVAARKILEQSALEFSFHDIRKDGLPEAKTKLWLAQIGREKLLNKKSTTWRSLSDEKKKAAENDREIIALVSETVTVIKRPVLEIDGKIYSGIEALQEIKSLTKK